MTQPVKSASTTTAILFIFLHRSVVFGIAYESFKMCRWFFNSEITSLTFIFHYQISLVRLSAQKLFPSTLNCLLARFSLPCIPLHVFSCITLPWLVWFFWNEREADVRQTHGEKKATAQRTSSHLLLLFSSRATSAEDPGLYAISKHDW